MTAYNKRYPQYVKTADGYIGVFKRLDFGEFPVYRFPGGERVADEWELKHGSDDYSLIAKESQADK